MSLRSGGYNACNSCAACSARLSSHKAGLEPHHDTKTALPPCLTHKLCNYDADNMAAAPFGFSVGDFFAGIQLIHKATKALRTASGATAQCQQAILDLESIATVLRRVQGLTPAKASEPCSFVASLAMYLWTNSCKGLRSSSLTLTSSMRRIRQAWLRRSVAAENYSGLCQ